MMERGRFEAVGKQHWYMGGIYEPVAVTVTGGNCLTQRHAALEASAIAVMLGAG